MNDHDNQKVTWKWQKPPGAPKRPLSAYNYFFSEMRKKILTGTNDGTTGGFSSLAKQISYLWKGISDLERQKYTNMAKESKEKYELLKTNWSQSEGYEKVLNGKYEKKRRIQAKYRARRKSKRLLEESNCKQGYSVCSSKDFMDDINYSSSSLPDCHALHLHDIAEEFCSSVGTIEDDDISQFTEPCHATIPHHDLYSINDIQVPVDIYQDEKSVSDLSTNITVPSIVEQLEYSSRFLQTTQDDVAALEHDGDQFVQRLDQESNYNTSYISNQENTSQNNDQNPRRVLTSSISPMQPAITEIERLYASRLEAGLLNFPVYHQKNFGIERFTTDSSGLNSSNQYDRVLNTTNCLFRHSIYDDACMPISWYNTVAASRNKDNCRFFSKDYLPSAYAHTSTRVHDPYNVPNQSLDLYSNCNEQSITDCTRNRCFPHDTMNHRQIVTD